MAVQHAGEVRARFLWAPGNGSVVSASGSSVSASGSSVSASGSSGSGSGSENGHESAFRFTSLRYLAQLYRTYLLCEGESEFVMIDQHAAHERVLFERLRARHLVGAPAVQPLLFAETFEVSATQGAQLEEFAAELAIAGFHIEPFGTSGGSVTLALKAAPAGLRADPAPVVRELLAELSDCGSSRAAEQRIDLVFATIACHSAVRAGDPLSAPEVDALFADLDATPYRAHCPHGRPVLWRWPLTEIARRFDRT
jgi:DNA mismatch repair protein MutL